MLNRRALLQAAPALARPAEIESRLTPGMTEERNLLDTGRLIVEAALLRRESRGGHYRSDFPAAASEPVHSRVVLRDGDVHLDTFAGAHQDLRREVVAAC